MTRSVLQLNDLFGAFVLLAWIIAASVVALYGAFLLLRRFHRRFDGNSDAVPVASFFGAITTIWAMVFGSISWWPPASPIEHRPRAGHAFWEHSHRSERTRYQVTQSVSSACLGNVPATWPSGISCSWNACRGNGVRAGSWNRVE